MTLNRPRMPSPMFDEDLPVGVEARVLQRDAGDRVVRFGDRPSVRPVEGDGSDAPPCEHPVCGSDRLAVIGQVGAVEGH